MVEYCGNIICVSEAAPPDCRLQGTVGLIRSLHTIIGMGQYMMNRLLWHSTLTKACGSDRLGRVGIDLTHSSHAGDRIRELYQQFTEPMLVQAMCKFRRCRTHAGLPIDRGELATKPCKLAVDG